MKSAQIFSFSGQYSVPMRENTDQKKLRIWPLLTQCKDLVIASFGSIKMALNVRHNSMEDTLIEVRFNKVSAPLESFSVNFQNFFRNAFLKFSYRWLFSKINHKYLLENINSWATQVIPLIDCLQPTSHLHIILNMEPKQLTAPFPQCFTGYKLWVLQLTKAIPEVNCYDILEKLRGNYHSGSLISVKMWSRTM